jgi:NAD(P) transhydrogenase
MTAEKFDLIVIGSGPAGEKGAAQAAYFGKRVALIEKEPFLGGAAANTGTLPSKTLRETALYLSGFRQREFFGLDMGLKQKVQVRDFLSRERVVTDQERLRVRENLHRHHVTLFRGSASFVDPHTVAVKPDRCPELLLHGDVILIATGSYPYRPPVFPFHDPRIYDSDTILTLEDIPGTLLVVGGGVIGCEYACIFAALGVHVTVVEKRGSLVAGMDGEIAESLHEQMASAGVRFFLNDSVESVRSNGLVEVKLTSGEVVRTHAVLVSSGRCGQTGALGLEKIGLTVNDRGQIPINAHFQTNLPHIYAAGDVIGNPALASTAMEQARLAMVYAFDLKYKTDLASVLPYGIYTIPECSMAGATEEVLKTAKTPYVVGKASYAANARGRIIGDRKGFLKLLFQEDDMRLLGVHMIGEQATELIHVGLTALLMKAGADLFIHTCYNYPTLSEVYKYATYDALGRQAAHKKERALRGEGRAETVNVIARTAEEASQDEAVSGREQP